MNKNRWEIDGDCSLCRREKYCSTPCTLHKRRQQRMLTNAILSAGIKAVSERMREHDKD